MTPWEDNKANPCNWPWFWDSIKWMETSCLCCTMTRALVLGIGLGFIGSAMTHHHITEIGVGSLFVLIVVVAAAAEEKKAD